MAISTRATNSGIRYQVRYRDANGRQASRQFRTRREATAFEAAEITSIHRGEWVDTETQDVTFAKWSQQWLDNNPSKRETTLARDEIIVRIHLVPAFGHRKLNQIAPADVQRLVNSWASLAPHTIHRQYRTLAAIFKLAVINDMITKSPCRRIKLPRVPRRKEVVVEAGDVQRIASNLGEYAPMAFIGVFAGLRWGEVAGLRVGDLDLLDRKIHIRQQASRDRNGETIFTVPKTDAGIRSLRIPPILAQMLAAHLSSRGLTAADAESLLFTTPQRYPLRYSNWLRRVWRPACELAGHPSIGFHDLRRANATAMIAKGVDLKTAQHRLGHADPRMTLAIYAQATSQADIDATAVLGTAFALSDTTVTSAVPNV